jgi:uncharacterized protein
MTGELAGLTLGAPGIYRARERPDRSLRPVRLDVAGFVGVAPRGPVDTPVLVRSLSDYQLRFGGDDGPGRLGRSVRVFFDAGGERAYVVRVGRPGREPAPADDDARAVVELGLAGITSPVRFVAADPGAWGNRLRVRLEFEATARFPVVPPHAAPADPPAAPVPDPAGTREVLVPAGLDVPRRSLLRVRGPGLAPSGELRWVEEVRLVEVAPGLRESVAVLDRPVPFPPATAGPASAPILADLVTGRLVIDDGDPASPRVERLGGLGLDPEHRDWLADGVRDVSLLIYPVGDWTRQQRLPPPNSLLTSVTSESATGGDDIDHLIGAASFFDERDDVDPDDEPEPDAEIAVATAGRNRLRGATGLARVAELGLIVAPDLLWDRLEEAPAPDVEPAPGGSSFQACQPAVETRYLPSAQNVLLDARNPDDLEEILRRQARLVALADRHRRFVVLLDVPQQLDLRGITSWRARFDSSYAAGYHPWLGVLRRPTRPVAAGAAGAPELQAVPASAFAAGIIAARERRLGLPWGPANELAADAVRGIGAEVTDAEHDVLHPLGVNVFRVERDGHRLTGARTLSGDRYLRQLSVRRLLTMLRLALDREMQWVVFEPNTPALRDLLRQTVQSFLRALYRTGAFAGDTEDEAFFVRAGDDLNPPASLALGRIVVEVGVAPAEPVEFIILRITRDGDGGIDVEEV